jgi:hypothetical protein
MCGVVLAGVLSTYTAPGYRSALYCAFMIAICRWFYAFYFIRGAQPLLISQQLQFVDYYLQQDQNKDNDKDEDATDSTPNELQNILHHKSFLKSMIVLFLIGLLSNCIHYTHILAITIR